MSYNKVSYVIIFILNISYPNYSLEQVLEDRCIKEMARSGESDSKETDLEPSK